MSATHNPIENKSSYRTPRWVKVFGIVALALILVAFLVLATGIGGEHGPGRHMLSDSMNNDSPTMEQEMQNDSLVGHTPPVEYGG